jgi:MYXO-CTERM domain-containing protein
LSGLGLAFISAPEPTAVAGGTDCVEEGECTFVKPNMMIIVDYSTSMNTTFGGTGTRWDATVDAIVAMIDNDSGFIGNNLNLALMRFGHDANGAGSPGGTINGDTSNPPITDGQALDIFWYDNGGADESYIECNGDAVKTAIQTVPAPMNGSATGIGTWTKGAMDLTASLIDESRTDHSEAVGDRNYINLVLTDGAYTGPDGIAQNTNTAVDNPALTAADLWDNDEVPTYVVAVAEGADLDLANELAAAGGTTSAIDGATPALLIDALNTIIQEIKDSVIAPECVGGMPRIMVLLDASSSMLNVGNTFGTENNTGWDGARTALAGTNSIFDLTVSSGEAVEDLSQLGLSVFGHNDPDESKVLVDYGPCTKDNFAWALDPNTSCDSPGCTDPWAGPPITWTFKDGSTQDPFFDQQTLSHMPKCDEYPGESRCLGSATWTHLGLNLVASNQAAYHANATMMGALYPANDQTQYFNILITDGNYTSSDAQVQNSLEAMYTDNITTYVIGFGEYNNFLTDLNNMASWGSGGTNTTAFVAANQTELEMQLQTIIDNLAFDPCCGFNDCTFVPEPTTEEPDDTTTSTTTTGDGDGDSGTTTGDGDGDSGGDGDTSTTGDGDGDTTTTGDGDGDTTTTGGDGDSGGDGDGDTSTTTGGDGDTGGDTTSGGTTDSDSATDTGGDTMASDTGDTGDAGIDDVGGDDGCNCDATGDSQGGGLLGFLGLGLLGLTRRRRRE